VNVAHNTPEQVALTLFHMVANVERRAMHHGATGDWKSADRQWILNTYAECLRAIQQPQAKTESRQDSELRRRSVVPAPAFVPSVPATTSPKRRGLSDWKIWKRGLGKGKFRSRRKSADSE
jgi:hypothetical protein